MKCIILAAGYATRLYPLTEYYPKPLLEIKGKAIIDWLIDDINATNEVDEFIVISNNKFADHFCKWAKKKEYKVTVLNDGTNTNETRLGAVLDILFVINKLYLNDNLLIIAGDNVLDFSLKNFIKYCQSKQASCVMRYFEPKTETLCKRGVLELHGDLVVDMQEKPQNPKSNWCCPPFYYITAHDTLLIAKAVSDGCGTDAPGSFIAWLCKNAEVYAMKMPGNRYDIGNLANYKEMQNTYKGIIK